MLLVTGATGYLGSALVHRAVLDGYDVRDAGRAAELLPAGVDVVVGDLADGAGLERAARGVHGRGARRGRGRGGRADGLGAGAPADDAADGHLLALERGTPGRRYVLCGEVAPFGRVLHTFARHVGGRLVQVLPPGSSLGRGAGTFARRSEVYGRFPPVRVDDAGARGLGFAPRGTEDGLALTAAWITTL